MSHSSNMELCTIMSEGGNATRRCRERKFHVTSSNNNVITEIQAVFKKYTFFFLFVFLALGQRVCGSKNMVR